MQNHARNLRKGRVSLPGHVYSVTTVTRDREHIFSDPASARLVISTLRYADSMNWSRSLAFVVMPDHVHWLFQLGQQKSLSQLVESVKKYSGRLIGRRIGRRVWQPGFHDHVIRAHEDLRGVARYIILNPVRAGLVGRIGKYPWWDAVWVDDENFRVD